jgi:ABC-type cobalamin/Fe3+-siderophores transport system ATPase subunit
MSLLSIEHVTKRFQRGQLERVAVRDVSLEIEQGELVAVWGTRRSGRSTLLRIAAGIESPEEGTVTFEGRDLARWRNSVLGRRIGYCRTSFSSADGGLVIERIAAGLLAQQASPTRARRRAQEMLVRVGAEHCAQFQCHELDGAELVRVAIASALATAPVLLVIDEPTNGVDLLERDTLLALLRSVASEGIAVLMSTGEAHGLSGVDRALSIDNGELRGDIAPREASVVPLRRTTRRVDVSELEARWR